MIHFHTDLCFHLHHFAGSGKNRAVAEGLDSIGFMSPFKALAPT
jgi:hypothetical protein